MGAELREECGIIGVYGDSDAARLAMVGLLALQHRGQEGAGIAAWDGRQLAAHRGQGLVGEVFGERALGGLRGDVAIGHVRYSTQGDSSLRNVQPLVVRYRDGQLALAHNGNLLNAASLRAELEGKGSVFSTSSDTEVILHLMAGSGQHTAVSRLVDALYALEGAYCLVLLAEDRLVAVRDPFGFRPLVLGRREGAWVVASETCALDLIDATYVREVAPGEMLIIDREGIQSLSPFPRRPRRACIFEQIYFARPDSVVFGRGVYETRVALGRRLAVEHPVEADLVIGVPDSGLAGAVGFAQESGLSFQHGLLRSHHVGRTFIEPSPQIRDLGVRLKLSPVRAVLAGRRVVVVDDSIVRGTTSRKIVRMIREAGAAAVHMRITAPPMTGGCHYGVDTPDRSELIAHRKNPEEIGRWIGADSVGFLSLEGLRAVEGAERGWCEACFSGDYPIQPSGPEMDSQVPLFPAARQPRDA